MRRYAVIGLGAAGVSAAESIRNHDPSGLITLIGDEPQGYYSRPGLAYYLTGEIPENQLFPYTDADFKALDVKRLHAQSNAYRSADAPARAEVQVRPCLMTAC